MNTYTVFAVFVLAAVVVAEPPSGYSYNRPGGVVIGGGHFGGGHSGGGHFGGGGYTAVSSGYQTSEGAHVDPVLLDKVRNILLQEEQNSHSSHSSGGGFIDGVSSQYGVPSPQYGVPGYHTRVVGINLEGIKQAIQVAQYNQVSHQSFGGYPSGPSGSYGVPSGSYGAPY